MALQVHLISQETSPSAMLQRGRIWGKLVWIVRDARNRYERAEFIACPVEEGKFERRELLGQGSPLSGTEQTPRHSPRHPAGRGQ